MQTTFKKALKGLIYASILLGFNNMQANNIAPSTYTWEGTTSSDLTVSSNWSPSVAGHPAAGDSGIFNSSIPPLSFAPTVSSTTSSNAFAIDLVQFTSPSSLFAFIIKDANTTFTFAGSGPGPNFGVQNNSGINQIFNINNQGHLIFQNQCSADLASGTSPGLVIYNIGDATTPGTVTFQDQSNAGEAFLLLKSGSTLTFEDGSSAGTAAINTNNDDVVNLEQDEDGIFEASLIGTGTVNKTGLAKLDFTTNNGLFNGETNIDAGNLALNNLLGGNVNVNSNGMLSGTGTVGGDLNVNAGGTVAPGNSIGIMTVNGDFTQAANSTFLVQADGSGNASKLIVEGQTSINVGANVDVIPSVVQLAPNTIYQTTILHSNSGVSGTYAGVFSTNPLIGVGLSYDPNDVFLIWVNALALIPKTSNQRMVTDQLQTLNAPGMRDLSVLTALVQLPEHQQQRALDQMTAQPYANLLLTAELADHKFIRRLYNPLRALVTAHPCCEADSCNPCGCVFDTWIDGGWNHSNFKGNRNARGFSLAGYEISLGVQTTIENCWTIGLAGSYENEKLKYKVGGTGRVNTYLGGIYTLFRPADFYVLSDLVLGCTKNNIKRHIDVGTYHFKTRGKPDVFQGSLYVEAGQDYALDCFLFQPFLGIEAGYFRHDQIHEHGSDSLFKVDVKNRSYGTASSRLGVHLLTEMSCLKLYVDAAWQYRLTSLRNRSREHFHSFGDAFTITGIPLSRSSFDGAVNLSAMIIDGWELYAEAEGQWWNNASTYTILGGLQISW